MDLEDVFLTYQSEIYTYFLRLAGDRHEAEERALDREDPAERVHLLRTLASLGENDREALVLVDVVGLAPGEAAEAAGIGADAFRVRLHRARARFKEGYEA